MQLTHQIWAQPRKIICLLDPRVGRKRDTGNNACRLVPWRQKFANLIIIIIIIIIIKAKISARAELSARAYFQFDIFDVSYETTTSNDESPVRCPQRKLKCCLSSLNFKSHRAS